MIEVALTLTDEQRELSAVVRQFVTDKAPSAAVRRWSESPEGLDQSVWRQMADQLGLQGLAIPEAYGGGGFGPFELGLVQQELGRVLFPGPFFASVVLAGQALTTSGDRGAMERWLPGIADGSLTATVAVSEGHGPQVSNPAMTARPAKAGVVLAGRKTLVVDGDTAELILMTATGPHGPSLYALNADAEGVRRRRLDALDPTRRLGVIEVTDAPAIQVGPAGENYLHRVLGLATVGLAAEQVGGASACLDSAVDYAGTRVQFGRPIGSFQAIKHKCADMVMEVEAARAAALHALSAAAEDPEELPFAAAVAGSYCASAYTHVAKEHVQIHGGVGFTWEHDAHLHLKRAKTGQRLFGSPVHHRGRLADLVGF